jgi:hypothetical protein
MSLQSTQRINSIPDKTELHSIIKNMRNNASPWLNGLNEAFYKSAWPWIADDVHTLVSNFYTTIVLHNDLNRIHIALIPKKIQPIISQDFKPINWCNVIYKVIAKSLANILKPHLPGFDNAQAAFIKNRHISSNIVITQEIIHSFNLRS